MPKRKLPPLALRLRTLREAAGLSAVALAEAIGVTRQYVYRLEAGQNEPTFTLLCRLADALGVTLNDFRG